MRGDVVVGNIDNDKMFERILKLYKEKKLMIEWERKSFFVRINDITNEERSELEKKKFKEFMGNFLKCVREKVIDNRIDNDMDEYVSKFLEEEKELTLHIFIQNTNLVNLCRTVQYEILTKMDNQSNVIGHSLLLSLGIEKPNLEIEPINFELSLKDLKFLYDTLGKAICKIEKLE